MSLSVGCECKSVLTLSVQILLFTFFRLLDQSEAPLKLRVGALDAGAFARLLARIGEVAHVEPRKVAAPEVRVFV